MITTVSALVGAADSGAFLVQRRRLLREAPGRAAGILASLGLWAGLAASSGRDRGHRSGRTLAIASVTAAGNGAMLAAHLRRGIAGPRVWLPALLSGAALAGAVLDR